MAKEDKYRDELLHTWEATYKKGQLTFWIFLALRDGAKYVYEIKEFIQSHSGGTISCEDQSLYRSLRKFTHLDMVAFHSGKGHKGPDRKYYALTDLGEEILQRFIERNIRLFFNPYLQQLMNLNLIP